MISRFFHNARAHITGGKAYPNLDGYAYMSILLNKFKIEDIIGKVIIIHDMPDDFTSQPSGNSGKKIACGVIEKTSRI